MKTHLSILVALAGSAAFAGNLISNGGFEMGTAGWTARRNVAIEDVQKTFRISRSIPLNEKRDATRFIFRRLLQKRPGR